MASKKKTQLKNAFKNLSDALDLYRNRDSGDPLPLLTVTKAFEVAVEYTWRKLKTRVEDEGLDAPSPKAAVRQAAKIGLIADPSLLLLAIEARNASVHDYFGIGEDEFIDLAEKFIDLTHEITD